jgi:tetratricopeptide (TPR) repeat protein
LIEANDFVGAGAALDKAVAVFPDPSWAYWKGTVLYHTQGAAAAREEFRRLFLMEEGPWRLRANLRLACVALAEGRFGEAEEECRNGAELAETIGELEWASDFRCLLGQVLLDEGKLDAALVEDRKAVERAQAAASDYRLRTAIYFQAQACVRVNDLVTVEKLTRQFQALAASGMSKRPAREYDLFRGMLELEKDRPLEAVKLIEKAISQLPPGNSSDGRKIIFYVTLASAREKAGDFAGASSAYEEVTGSAGDRLQIAEYYPWAVLGRARMEEKLVRPARALEGYRSFLALWKDADPGRPEVAEARGRIDALSGAPGRSK